MRTQRAVMRNLGKALLGGATFLSGAVLNPETAGAHCGGHGGSCENRVYGDYQCMSNSLYQEVDTYGSFCSGTCYNGTQGCCTSPAACADYPCKPGGCDYSNCVYLYTQWEWLGIDC